MCTRTHGEKVYGSKVNQMRTEEGSTLLILEDIEASNAQYREAFEIRLRTLLKSLAFLQWKGRRTNPRVIDGRSRLRSVPPYHQWSAEREHVEWAA